MTVSLLLPIWLWTVHIILYTRHLVKYFRTFYFMCLIVMHLYGHMSLHWINSMNNGPQLIENIQFERGWMIYINVSKFKWCYWSGSPTNIYFQSTLNQGWSVIMWYWIHLFTDVILRLSDFPLMPLYYHILKTKIQD